jgi:hypothetical protein
MADALLSGELGNILNFLGAVSGLGTAAMGLVDATKAFGGGPSNFGFKRIKTAVRPFLSFNTNAEFDVLQTLKANWLNGVAKADQKAKAKSLIHLGLTKDNAAALAAAAGVDAVKLQSLATKTATGTPASQDEINVLGQFDVVLSAILDAAYERGDQQYRNACKVLALIFSTILGGIGGWIVFGYGPQLALSLLVGFTATPLAPVSKDLASSLQAAVTAVGTIKR